MNSFNHCDDFMRFVTESHVILLALKLTGLTEVSDIPPPAIDDLQKFLEHTSQLVVDHAWLMPPLAAVKDVAEQPAENVDDDCWCICGEGESKSCHLGAVFVGTRQLGTHWSWKWKVMEFWKTIFWYACCLLGKMCCICLFVYLLMIICDVSVCHGQIEIAT